MAACLPSHRNAWNVHAPWCWVSSWCGRPCLMPCLLHTRPVAITCRGRAAASSRTGYEPLVGSHAPPCCAWVLLVVLMMKPSSGDPAQCSVPPACLMKALLVAATLCWASAVCSLQSVGVFFWSISISRRPRIVHVHIVLAGATGRCARMPMYACSEIMHCSSHSASTHAGRVFQQCMLQGLRWCKEIVVTRVLV